LKIVYVKINKTGKDVLTPMVLIGSNPIWLNSLDTSSDDTLSINSLDTSSDDTLSINSLETSSSDTLSVNSLETSTSDTLSVNPLETIVPQPQPHNMDLFDFYHWQNIRFNEWETLSNDEFVRPVDSITLLNSQTLEQWREIVRDLHELSIGSPATLIQQVKFEELNILYSLDLINFGITQTELRLIIEHVPVMHLFDPTVNHFILTIMSYYHF
jgi:hypothetical protein